MVSKKLLHTGVGMDVPIKVEEAQRKPLFVRTVAVTAPSPALGGWHWSAEGMGCLP